jgi:hypothetical protein
MIGTYHEYAPVGKRFESGQFPHHRAALDAKNHSLILPKSTAINPPPANHKPVTPAKAGVHLSVSERVEIWKWISFAGLQRSPAQE